MFFQKNEFMSHLKKFRSFQELKKDNHTFNSTQKNIHLEFEEALKVLRQKYLASKK